jgi:uncharacterized repeat protein (TIGR01451 family)
MLPEARTTISKWQIAAAGMFAGVLAAISIVFADPVSPLTLTNVDSPDPVASGAELTFTITAVNTGGAKIDNAILTDQLNSVGGIGVPPQFVVTNTRGSCTQTVNKVTCAGGSIEGGGSWTVTIRGIVTAPNGTTINNTATVSFNKSSQNFTNASTATTLVSGGTGTPLPDLTIAKTGPASVAASSPIAYTLTVNNLGTANANDIKVVDTLPLGLSNVSFSTTSLFACTKNEPALPHPPAVVTVTCTGGRVNAGANGTVTINATAPATSGSITNTASVDPDNTIAESNELNNTSSLVNTQVGSAPPPAPLSIVKTDTDAPGPDWSDGAGPDPVTPGQTLTYKILVTNNSDTRANDVTMVDGTQSLGAATVTVTQVVINGTVGTGGGCQVMAPQVHCLARTLNPGGTILYTVSGQVVGSAGSTIINTATVSGNIKNQSVSSSSTVTTTVRPSIDLTITNAAAPDPVCASSWPTTAQGGAIGAPSSPPLLGVPPCLGGLKYTLVIGNSGVDNATGVVVRDNLPPGTTFDHVAGDLGSFSGGCSLAAGNVLTCSGGTIPPASTRTLFVWAAAPPVNGSILNTATVDPNNAIFEADETNNTASVSSLVTTGVDLTIVKFDSPPDSPGGFDPIATSGTETYVIKVEDIGTQSAANIRVRDTLPANTVFRSAQGDHGFTCSQAGGVVECAGGLLPGTFDEFYSEAPTGEQKATITIRVFAQPTVGTMHNEVRVDPLNEIVEVNETNNIAFQDTTVVSGGHDKGAFNELTITKNQTLPLPVNVPVARNAKMTFEIKVTNDGTDPALGVTVRDFLPAGAQYIEATGTNKFLCSQVSSFINCGGGELGAFGSGTETATITLTMFAPDTPAHYTNQAIVDPDNTIGEGNEFDNQSNAPFDVANGGVGAYNDLTITKGPKNITVKPGEEIAYTLTVQNIGLAPALNVAVRDSLPADVTFESAADTTLPASPGGFTCAYASGVVNCTGATLDGSLNTLMSPDIPDTRTITIKVTAPTHQVPAKGLINQAIVDPDNAIHEGDETNNTDSAAITVSSVINLRVTKTGPTESDQSQTSQYTITVFNDKTSGGDGQDAFGVELADPLPVGLIPLAASTGSGNNWQCQISENPINLLNCNGDLAQGTSVTITVDVFMTAEGGRALDNEACVDPRNKITEFKENDNCSTATTLGGSTPKLSPDLLVTKSVSPSGPVSPGTDLTYTVSISNVGTAKAKGPINLVDTLPDHVTFANADTTNGWSCSFAAPKVTCHETPAPDGGNGMDVGESATITIHASYTGGSTVPLVNSATADPASVDGGADDTHEDETSLLNNTATAKNSVGTSGIDLVVSKIIDQPDPVAIGQKLNYTIVVVNGGTNDTSTTGHDVVVRLDVPQTGVVFLSTAGSNGFNCDGSTVSTNHQIICTGSLPGGGDTTITAKFNVVFGAPTALSLTATVDPDNVIPETDEGNNTLTEPTSVQGDTCPGPPCIDLVAAQLIGSPDPYPNNGTVTMSFVVINVGDTATSLDPDPTHGQPLARFDMAGAYSGTATRTVTPTNPSASISCVTDPLLTTAGSNLFSNCYGNLGPGEGVTITVVFTGVTAPTVSGVGTADPDHHVVEFSESNNSISKTVIKQM